MKTILLLGGNRYNIKPIEAVRRAGFRVIVADQNPDAPGLAVADIGLAIDLFDYDSLEQAIRKIGTLDGVVSMAEAGIRPAAELSKRFGLNSMPEQVAYNATSKAAMREHWAGSPYSVDFRVVSNLSEAQRAIEELNFWPLIVKPDHSFGGSRGVRRIEKAAELEEAIELALAGGRPGSKIVIEACLSGPEYSTEVLIYEGRASVLTIGKKVKTPYPYRVDQSIQYSAPLSPEQEAEVARMCQFATEQIGHQNGVAHVEFAYTEDGPVLFELGARCGGGHTPLIARHTSGVNELVELCRIACGIAPEQTAPIHRKGADYRFLLFPQGQIKEIIIPEEIRSHPNILDVDITMLPGQSIGSLQSTSGRPGFLVTLGESREEAIQLADDACEKIMVRYEDGRSSPALFFSGEGQ